MNLIDWVIVILLNGSIIVYGIWLSRGVQSSVDWFLAGRTLPWWLVGVSMYATAIDASDLIADSGGTYTLGLSYFVTNWVGITGGWLLGAFVIYPSIYRAGMYTNAEYLEARFGPSVRVLCALIQVQYRTLVLAIIATTLYLTLSIVCGWTGIAAWLAVGVIAALATVYTALGGLKSVAVTDSLQFLVMTVSGLIIWGFVWNMAGGWQGISDKLNDHQTGLAAELLQVRYENVEKIDVSGQTSTVVERRLLTGGTYNAETGEIIRRTPAWLVAIAFMIVGVAYSIVNHTQTMRMFASKSEWDMKMSVWVAGVAMLLMTFFNLTMGVMGRALFPDVGDLPLERTDAIYPHLVNQFSVSGLKGIVVAGVLAASFSTFDSIGSTLSALLTRDVYARLFVRDRDDRHYMRVGQWLTPLIIAGSFLYVPFMEGGMLLFYLDLTSAFVIPLLTLFLMGVLTRVHRRAGLIGLLVGAGYGAMRLIAERVAVTQDIQILPAVMVNSFAAYLFSILITAGTMVLVSMIIGWESKGPLSHVEQPGWLRTSQLAIQQLETPDGPKSSTYLLPLLLAFAAFAIGCWLSFAVFW
jgi:SSS family solute:Na+ symporter